MDYFLLFSLVSMTCVMSRPARSEEEFRSMEFPAPFFFANKRLTNHTIRVIGILDMDLCELMCYQEPNCVSFNLRKKLEKGEVKRRCELNNSTHLENDSEFKDDPFYFYRGAKNACVKMPCQNNGICQSGFTDKGYRCVCPKGFSGRHCEEDENYNYTLTVYTGDRKYAGTDARVFVKIFGEMRISGEVELVGTNDTFDRDSVDIFDLILPNLGRLTKLTVRHDNTGYLPGWFLSKIIVRNAKEGVDTSFVCSRWIISLPNKRTLFSSQTSYFSSQGN